jgi:cyclopropane-fatty-acyl-phospholipid synthase
MRLGDLVVSLLGEDLPVRLVAWDGTDVGPKDAPATIVLRSRDALRRIVTMPGELGFARAFVSGDAEIEGDIFSVLTMRDRLPTPKLSPRQLVDAMRLLGFKDLTPLPVPKEEIRLRGKIHSKERDAAAVAAHYDVGNDFYSLFLGDTMTYSCAVFEHEDQSLDEAQRNKYELICRKLDLQPGMRLLDVGCGWGGMAIHAAQHYGVQVVGVTLSTAQRDLAEKRVAAAGMSDRIEIRYQDYRDVADGPYDAISSIGMFEHVGEAKTREYFATLHGLLRPHGRLLNHAISRPWSKGRARVHPRGFIHRYVFPDGELLEVGTLISAMHEAGFEVRHEENLREHYAQTLRHWVRNLEARWDDALRIAGDGRARVWRLYMAGSSVMFQQGQTQIHQVLGVKAVDGDSGVPLRTPWERVPLGQRPQ